MSTGILYVVNQRLSWLGVDWSGAGFIKPLMQGSGWFSDYTP